MSHLSLCEMEVCATCGTGTLDTNQAGECRPCATLTHNLRMMAAGVTRNKTTGRYARIERTK